MAMNLDTAAADLRELSETATALNERLAAGDSSVTTTLAAQLGALALANTNILIALLNERAAAADTP